MKKIIVLVTIYLLTQDEEKITDTAILSCLFSRHGIIADVTSWHGLRRLIFEQ